MYKEDGGLIYESFPFKNQSLYCHVSEETHRKSAISSFLLIFQPLLKKKPANLSLIAPPPDDFKEYEHITHTFSLRLLNWYMSSLKLVRFCILKNRLPYSYNR